MSAEVWHYILAGSGIACFVALVIIGADIWENIRQKREDRRLDELALEQEADEKPLDRLEDAEEAEARKWHRDHEGEIVTGRMYEGREKRH